ncbi:MAG: hypothetical protein OJF51_000513 [Nitrospira sp.]|nr:MAG: hypothetical protein OJF51_000513 [Nitrospira sp.]
MMERIFGKSDGKALHQEVRQQSVPVIGHHDVLSMNVLQWILCLIKA